MKEQQRFNKMSWADIIDEMDDCDNDIIKNLYNIIDIPVTNASISWDMENIKKFSVEEEWQNVNF